MQAIQTKYFPPGNVRASYIKAWCQAKSIRLKWDDSRNPENNHAFAAQKLAQMLGWTKDHHGAMFGGQLPGGDYAWVFDNKQSPYTFACGEVNNA